MVKIKYTFLLAFIYALAGNSCKETGNRFPDQGEIHYIVSYEGNINQMPKELMPKNLILSFKNNNILYELLSPFGNSGISNLSNPSKDIYDTYLSLFTIKFFYSAKPGEVYPGFEAMDGMEINKTEKTMDICGFRCKNAQVTLPYDRNKIYDIWYTDEIPVKNPNAFTPFSQIEGVLLRFFFLIGDSEFHFEAENVYRKELPDAIFERKDKYVRVTRDDIEKFIYKMVNL